LSPLSALFAAPRKIYKISELTTRLRAQLESDFSDIFLMGEVTNLKNSSSGHLYFSLKDELAQIRAVLFRSYGRPLKHLPQEGKSFLVRGHLTVYEARGEYQLVVDYLEPAGIGVLQAAYEALRARLQAEGLFDPARKKPIPLFPRRVVLITSLTGAALQDMLKVFMRNPLPYEILIAPVLVQGEGAAGEISRAIDGINFISRERGPSGPIDLIILARGGGSYEDLLAFNNETVVRAIAASHIPIISAIGHETDVTLSDFVADLRVPTPSVAAEEVVRNISALIHRYALLDQMLKQKIQDQMMARRVHLSYQMRLLTLPIRSTEYFFNQVWSLTVRLQEGIGKGLSEKQGRLTRCGQTLHHFNPIRRLKISKETWQRLNEALIQAATNGMTERRRRLHVKMSEIALLSPLNVLTRGYSITQKMYSREILRDVDTVAIGDEVAVTLQRGELFCSVKERRPGR